jgi:hypothetical protein
VLEPKRHSTEPVPTATEIGDFIFMGRIQDVHPPLWKPDDDLKKVLERAPCPEIRPSGRCRTSLPVHALGDLEVVDLTKNWLQKYATLISGEEGGLPRKPAEQNIVNKLRKLSKLAVVTESICWAFQQVI